MPAKAKSQARKASDTPQDLPLIVIKGMLGFPNTILPLEFNQREAESRIVLDAQRNGTSLAIINTNNPPDAPILGIEADVIQITEDGTHVIVLIRAQRRVWVMPAEVTDDSPRAQVKPVVETTTRDASSRELIGLFRQVVMLDENIPQAAADQIQAVKNLSSLTDLIATVVTLPEPIRSTLFATLDVNTRISLLTEELLRQMNEREARGSVNDAVQNDMANSQREAYLREQMRIIQGELGEADPFQADITTLQARILAANMPASVQERALTELSRLGIMQPMSPESGIIRTYIQWLIDVPWTQASKDKLNLANAEKVLKKAHYGLDKIRDRILEHIAVRKLAGNKMRSPILCFVGPPGVGKTSLGKAIADALGREFVRVSLGGVRDEAEIRGHRRTYIGALPGRIIETMKRAGTINPVFMLDEIDKMSDDYRGDPASALLEVLDPEQNNAFSDHYLEVPYDLSQVLFITTANDLDPLPEALEDRMEIIEFRAYTDEEKIEIAQQFLIPKTLQSHGLSRRRIIFQRDALYTLARQYTMEAGVRNLEREIGTICRKLARLVASNRPYPHRITPQLVEKFLGAPYVIESRVNRDDSVGLVTGLVWSPSGGDTQVIEVSLLPGKGSLLLTGSLGDVLQESAQTALSYMRSRAYALGIHSDDFEDYDIHIHLPEGGVPKDGPSAGIALVIGIMSAFTEQKVRATFAITGEVTLRGHVLPVGGIKEKVLSARRRKIAHIILPADNKKDLVDIPKSALKDVTFHFVQTMAEVEALMLLEAPPERQRDIEAAARDAQDDAEEAERRKA